MNTRLYYSYTDGNNYDCDISVVVAGAISEEQRAQIRQALDHEELFVPTQVGLPDGSMVAHGYQPCDLDGNAHRLDAAEIELTEDAPTVRAGIAALAEGFAEHGSDRQDRAWNWNSLSLPTGSEWAGMALVEDLEEAPERASAMTIWAVARVGGSRSDAIRGDTVERRVWRHRATAMRALRAARREVKAGSGMSCWGEAYTEMGWAVCCRAWQERGYTPLELLPLQATEVGLGV
jgi:hypothetical protein